MRIQSTEDIKTVLGNLAFPASKEEIVDHARGTRDTGGTGYEEVLRALAALPAGEYANMREVMRSVPAQPGPERGDAERAYQQRHHRKAGLAEHMRDVELPPVEEEMRRDRPGQ